MKAHEQDESERISDIVMQAYMLKYDSTHGLLKSDVHAVDDKTLQVGTQTIKVFGCRYSKHSRSQSVE